MSNIKKLPVPEGASIKFGGADMNEIINKINELIDYVDAYRVFLTQINDILNCTPKKEADHD